MAKTWIFLGLTEDFMAFFYKLDLEFFNQLPITISENMFNFIIGTTFCPPRRPTPQPIIMNMTDNHSKVTIYACPHLADRSWLLPSKWLLQGKSKGCAEIGGFHAEIGGPRLMLSNFRRFQPT